MEEINKRINELRHLMYDNGIDVYIVCTDDYHNSEYVGDYFKEREFISGFTGSAGIAVITNDEALLWTDGRYFIQAEMELKDSEFKLMKIGVPGVKKISEYLCDTMLDGDTLGFDGRTVSVAFVKNIDEGLKGRKVNLVYDVDLIDYIWSDRPELSKKPVFELDIKYAGVSREEKISKIRSEMEKTGADVLLITALDEIAWILNLRGDDVLCNPVFLAYMIIEKDKVHLFINESILNENIKEKLIETGVSINRYNDFYSKINEYKEKVIMYDPHKINFMTERSIDENNKIIIDKSPVERMKAIKNEIEYNNIIKAHIKDGVAVTKFMYWLKNNVGKIDITEISAAEKLEEFRREQDNYLGPSFEPIVAYGAHGAIVHYSVNKKTDVVIENKGLLLSDTGGHYIEGTTDITRTFAFSDLTDEEKKSFTLVLAGHLNLANAKFKYGITGMNLDYLARGPLWREGLDYNHGTGHGVGYLLNVHEGPNSIGWQSSARRTTNTVFEEGMITSNEPGVYFEGKFGIRHENMILCLKDEENEYGQFMKFVNLTMVPFDLDGVDKKYLSDREVMWLNEYHKEVYEKISPYLNEDEREWLKRATRSI